MINSKSLLILKELGTKYRIPSKEFCNKVTELKKERSIK